MTYQQTLDYLFTQLPMYQRQGAAAMKKDLTNTFRLLEWLGNPHERLRCIHVAGTNGKGTVCHLLAAALQEQGYRVGMYTSPHYKDFRERIKINGRFIPEAAVIDFTARLQDADLGDLAPSFFEITVAMAFDYFAAQAPDYCIIEVGLGGRLDSTNVITPLLSVITNIGMDHTQFLGDTLELIAAEKAGIIKPGVPTVVGRRQAETTAVYATIAAERGSQITYSDDRFELLRSGASLQVRQKSSETSYQFRDYTPPMNAAIRENLLTALTALQVLGDTYAGYSAPGFRQLDTAWAHMAENTYYIGRFQRLNHPGSATVLADSAHNEDGLRITMDWLASFPPPLHIVLGVVNDKDLDSIFPLFPRNATYYFAKADIPRGLPAETLQHAANQHALRGQTYPSVPAAFTAATSAAATGTVFVGGSIFTVAEIL